MVYVDDMMAPFRHMVMCHMIADTTEELLQMANRIGVQHKWIQYPGTYKEHFDIAKGARRKAIAAGAQSITWRKYAKMVNNRKQHGVLNPL